MKKGWLVWVCWLGWSGLDRGPCGLGDPHLVARLVALLIVAERNMCRWRRYLHFATCLLLLLLLLHMQHALIIATTLKRKLHARWQHVHCTLRIRHVRHTRNLMHF